MLNKTVKYVKSSFIIILSICFLLSCIIIMNSRTEASESEKCIDIIVGEGLYMINVPLEMEEDISLSKTFPDAEYAVYGNISCSILPNGYLRCSVKYRDIYPDPTHKNDLLEPGRSYFLYFKDGLETKTVTLCGKLLSSQISLKVEINNTNWVGFNSYTPLPIEEALGTVFDKVIKVQTYIGGQQLTYLNPFFHCDTSQNNLDEMIPGYAYWITITENCEWSIPVLNKCSADFDSDSDVDGQDLAFFASDFGRTDCQNEPLCAADFDRDGDVDGQDLTTFAGDFGRTDCQ